MVVKSVTPWLSNTAPVAWTNGRIYYNQLVGKVFRSFSVTPSGQAPVPVTAATFPATTNQGIADVSPDGKYALVTVERANHWPIPDGDSSAYPGNGAYNDLWLLDLQDGSCWKLVDLVKTGSSALIWPRFDRTGSRITWAEQHQPFAALFGYWTLHVADLVWNSGGVPALTNIKSYQGDGKTWFEPYCFSPDGSKILFASEAWSGGKLDQSNTQIMSMASNLSGPVGRLSPSSPWEAFPFANYCEFAFYTPDGQKVIYSRISGARNGSLEYWLMNPDGSGSARLTYLSAAPATATTILGMLAFNPADHSQFVAGAEADYSGHWNGLLFTVAS